MKFVAVVLALVATLGTAHAADKAKARAAFREGTQHFRLGEYEQARASFKEAYRNFEDPTILFNLAQCERQLDHKQDALSLYRNYLAEVPSATNRAEVEGHITRLEAALAAEKEATAAADAKAREAAAPAPVPAAVAVVAAPAPPPKTPVYKKWWLWTTVSVVAVGIGLGVGLGVGLHQNNALSGTSFGVAKPF